MRRNFRENRNDVLLRGNEGFTLLEVLISVIILAISLLAIASGEMTSVTTSRGARDISIGAAAGQEIIERIQRNRANVLSYHGFDTSNAATKPAVAGMAQTDYDRWKTDVERVVGGRGQVQVNAGTPITSTSRVTVTITVPPRTITLQAVLQ